MCCSVGYCENCGDYTATITMRYCDKCSEEKLLCAYCGRKADWDAACTCVQHQMIDMFAVRCKACGRYVKDHSCPICNPNILRRCRNAIEWVIMWLFGS